MLYNKAAVLDFLPHRPPFLFVDSIEEVHLTEGWGESISNINSKSFVGSYAVGDFKIRPDLEILKGHFPGNPILPGVVQVEMGAQVCPFIFMNAFEDQMSDYVLDVSLLGVDKTRFRKPIVPGMNIRFRGKLIKTRGPYMTFECEMECAGEIVSSSEVFALLNFNKKEG